MSIAHNLLRGSRRYWIFVDLKLELKLRRAGFRKLKRRQLFSALARKHKTTKRVVRDVYDKTIRRHNRECIEETRT